MASVVDGMIVGSLLGDEALAAIGLATPVLFCINLIYLLFAVGGLTYASIALGKRQLDQAKQIFTLTIGGGISVMFLFVVVMQCVLRPLSFRLAGGDAVLVSLTETYLRPLVYTGPVLMFDSGMALFIRIDGKPKASAVIILVSNAVNLVLDYVMIRYLNTGIWGAGLSTTMGYVVGSLVTIPYLLNKKRSFCFVLPGRNSFSTVLNIIRYGLSKGISQICNILRSLALNAIIISVLGSLGMSVMTVCNNALVICLIFVGGVSDALLPMVGTLYGEKDYRGMRYAMKVAGKILALCCTLLTAFFLTAPQVMGLAFGMRSSESLDLLKPTLRMFALYLPFFSAAQILQNFYNTTGRKKLASAMVTMDGLFFVVPFAALFSRINPDLLWLCYAFSGAATLLVTYACTIHIRKKEEARGILMIQEPKDHIRRFDFTICACEDEAVRLSERVLAMGEEYPSYGKLINRIAVVMEEMVMAIIHNAGAVDRDILIDVIVCVGESQITLHIRDGGRAFNPLDHLSLENEEDLANNIQLIDKLSANWEYGHQLGFNNSVLTFDLPS